MNQQTEKQTYDNDLNLLKEEILAIKDDIEIENKYLDMIYTRNAILHGKDWLKNNAFCEDFNKQASDLIFDLSKNIDDVFNTFENNQNKDSFSKVRDSIIQLSIMFENINIALITNIYKELYRNVNGIGAKNEDFINIIKENLKNIEESLKEENQKIDSIELDEELFEKYNEETIFFFIIKPLLLRFKEGALINLKQTIKSHEQRIKELSGFVEDNDKFYNLMCINKGQNLSDRIILANASKTFSELHYLNFDEELIKGLFALNPQVTEAYNALITQEVIEELNIEFLLRDALRIKDLKQIMSQISDFEIQASEKYQFPDILYSDEYIIITNPETEEVVPAPKLQIICDFLALNEMNYDKAIEDIKVVIVFTIKKIKKELEKIEGETTQELSEKEQN